MHNISYILCSGAGNARLVNQPCVASSGGRPLHPARLASRRLAPLPVSSSPSRFPLSASLARHAQSSSQATPCPRRARVCGVCNKAPGLLCARTPGRVCASCAPAHTRPAEPLNGIHTHVVCEREGERARKNWISRQRGSAQPFSVALSLSLCSTS
jgi:hypothetical protein